MTATSTPVSRASILSSFMSLVQNPVMATSSSWSSTTLMHVEQDAVHRLMGPRNQDTPVFPNNVGEITTTNVFYLLHGFAVALTRHRRARGWIETNSRPIDLGYALTSYAVNNVIWFSYPTIPDVGTPITGAILNNFMNALRAQVQAIKTDNSRASDIVACHSSCHSSCHGSRGRR